MMSYNEKVDALVAFCDKYEEMIDNAKEGSDLWAFKELDKVYAQVDGDGTDCKEHLVNAMMFLAERFNDEYEMSPEALKAWLDNEYEMIPEELKAWFNSGGMDSSDI